MCFVPVRADTDIHDQRYFQFCDLGHERPQHGMYLLTLGIWHVQYQFIMHLHDEPRLQTGLLQPALNGDHRQLDQVGCGALHGGINSSALGALATALLTRLQIG